MPAARPKKNKPVEAVPAQAVTPVEVKQVDNRLIIPDQFTEDQRLDLSYANTEIMLQKYTEACATPSDINQLLPYLRAVSDKCGHITEFGVRKPTSTWALLAGNPERLVSYDIICDAAVDEVEAVAPNFTFVLGNTLEVDIEETDFLFIDTFHTAEQLSMELIRHAHKVRKYLGFHDVHTFGEIGEAEYSSGLQYGSKPGLRYAIEPFLQLNPEWKVDFHTTENNGLLILRRV